MRANFGCGTDYRKDWVNIDYDKTLKADKYADLNKIPFPFKNASFSEIYCENFIEHLKITVPEFLLECRRVLKREGKVVLVFPNAWWWRCRLSFLLGSFLWKSHYSPYHFNQLVKPSWIKVIAKSIGFEIIEGEKCGGLSGFLFKNNMDLREATASLTLRKRG